MGDDHGSNVPRPEAFERYLAGEELTDREHLHVQTFLLACVLSEVEHVCSNTAMSLSSIGELFEAVDRSDGPAVELVPEEG